jgi:hypothetical protein
LKTDVSPMFLTYFMLDWSKIGQESSDQKCTECGGTMRATEPLIDKTGLAYVGYVCHSDKRVIWVKSK